MKYGGLIDFLALEQTSKRKGKEVVKESANEEPENQNINDEMGELFLFLEGFGILCI